jgi:xanthosine utilization system XapX-like protein
MKSLNTLTAYVTGVVIAWPVVFAIATLLKAVPPAIRFSMFVLGMLSMYIAARVYPSKRRDSTT